MKKHIAFGILLTFAGPSFVYAHSDLESCRQNIAQIICLVNPVNSGSPDENSLNRPCLPGGEKYRTVFEGHFDRANPLVAKMYCHIEKIFVETSFYGTAYAAMVPGGIGKPHSGIVGIRKELLDNPLDLQTWFSWKEETSFGGSPDMTTPRLNLIQYQANPNSAELAIDYILNHEFGHLFDFANTIVQKTDCRWSEDESNKGPVGACTSTPGTWSALSWKDIRFPWTQHDYPLRDKTCFYVCAGVFLAPMDAVRLFNGLISTNFVSTYAATNMHDDWAESFAYFLFIRDRGFSLQVQTQGVTYDLTRHFNSPLLESKRIFIENFLNGKVLYPGDHVSGSTKTQIHRDH